MLLSSLLFLLRRRVVKRVPNLFLVGEQSQHTGCHPAGGCGGGGGQRSDLPLGPSAVRVTCELHMTPKMRRSGGWRVGGGGSEPFHTWTAIQRLNADCRPAPKDESTAPKDESTTPKDQCTISKDQCTVPNDQSSARFAPFSLQKLRFKCLLDAGSINPPASPVARLENLKSHQIGVRPPPPAPRWCKRSTPEHALRVASTPLCCCRLLAALCFRLSLNQARNWEPPQTSNL